MAAAPKVLPSSAVSVQRVTVANLPGEVSGPVMSGFSWPVVAASFRRPFGQPVHDILRSVLATLTEVEQPMSKCGDGFGGEAAHLDCLAAYLAPRVPSWAVPRERTNRH